MHTVLQRLNAVGTFAGTVLTVFAALVALTGLLHQSNPTAHIALNAIEGLQKEYGVDRAWPSLHVNADLRSLFGWNTKQVFVSIEIDYATERHPHNSMMIWARIIKKPNAAQLKLKQLRPIYPFMLTDEGTGLRGTPFNVSLKWNIMPRIGVLTWDSRSFTGFLMPDEYVPYEARNSRAYTAG